MYVSLRENFSNNLEVTGLIFYFVIFKRAFFVRQKYKLSSNKIGFYFSLVHRESFFYTIITDEDYKSNFRSFILTVRPRCMRSTDVILLSSVHII